MDDVKGTKAIMALEIERKSIIDSVPSGLENHRHELIQQGYLGIASDGMRSQG